MKEKVKLVQTRTDDEMETLLSSELNIVSYVTLAELVQNRKELFAKMEKQDGYIYAVIPFNHKFEILLDEVADMNEKKQKHHIKVQMNWRFSVLVDGQPVKLGSKMRGFIAYLIMKQGTCVKITDIAQTVFEREFFSAPEEKAALKPVYNLIQRLKQRLAEYGISDLIVFSSVYYCRIDLIDECDYLEAVSNGTVHELTELLSEFSWAETMIQHRSCLL